MRALHLRCTNTPKNSGHKNARPEVVRSGRVGWVGGSTPPENSQQAAGVILRLLGYESSGLGFFGLPPFLPLARAAAAFLSDVIFPSSTAAGFLGGGVMRGGVC